MCIFIKALIDPTGDNRPNLCPRKDSEWVLLFQENYLIAIDNLATISSSTSDTLCGYVTGIKERRRKLYTDNEKIDYDICQPIILNGIHDVIKNEDMLSRSIILILEFKIINCCHKDDFQWAAVVLKNILNLGVRFKDYEQL